MTKTLTLLISFCCLTCSCYNSSNDKASIVKLSDILKKYEEPSQITKISADKPSVITGRIGTKISINPNDLITESGKPLGQNIEVELKELINQGQLLRTNAQTVSDGKILISGGAYYIGMTSNGERLKLKDGKTLKVQFPKLTDNEMALFYGQRDDLGQINWQKATETLKTTQIPASTQPVTDTLKTTRKSDTVTTKDSVNGGYNLTSEEKANNLQQEKNYIISQKVYNEIGIDKLGWINCDRFLEVKDKTELYISFNPQDSIKNANVFLVFKDINSVIQTYYYSEKSLHFENMPVGYKARLIAYTIKDEKVFAYSTDLTINKGQNLTLNLKEISEIEFKKLIGD